MTIKPESVSLDRGAGSPGRAAGSAIAVAGIPSITLNDGASIPQFGLGVWRVRPEDTAVVVRTALEAGYRHVDTAQMYRNETGIGHGIRDAGIAREDVWVTTKLAGS